MPVVNSRREIDGPTPVTDGGGGMGIILVGTLFLVMGGAVLLPAFFPTRTAGATRSARLVWEERQHAIDEAIQEQSATEKPQEATTSELSE